MSGLPEGFVRDTAPASSGGLPPGFVRDVTPGGVPIGANGLPRVVIGQEPVVEAAPAPEPHINAGVQGAGRGIADTIGMLPDIANIGTNAILALADKGSRLLGGPELNYRFPMNSDEIAGRGSRILQMLGQKTADPEEMSTAERIAYNVNRFGTQGALTAGLSAPLATARAAEGASRLPKYGDGILRAYEAAPAKTGFGDTVANATAGAALTAPQSMSDEKRSGWGGTVGVGADLVAMLAGAHAGGTAAGAASTPGYIKNLFRERMPARDIPYDPETGLSTTNRQADAAARYVQGNTANPKAAADAIADGAAEFRGMDAPLPTAGALSRDPKLMAVERGERNANPGDFAVKDMALRDAALDRIERIQPQGVDPRDATNFFRDEVNARTGSVAEALASAQQNLAAAEAKQRGGADALRPLIGRMSPASESLDDLVLNKSLRPMDAARRADFNAVPREATVPGEPFAAAADKVRATAAHLPDNAQTEVLPAKRLEDFESFIHRDEKGNITGVDPISFAVINDMRPILGAETARARVEGAPPSYIDNLETLRKELNKASELMPEAKTANENYREKYAPVWGRGAGEAYDFRSDFNVDRSNRTASPPTTTAGRFLTTGAGAKEKAAALARIVESMPNAADKEATVGAVRQYVLSDLTKTIGADGKIAETSLARWLNGPSGWGDALTQFPTVRKEVDQLLSEVQSGAAHRNAMAKEVELAGRSVKRTQDEVSRSALSLTLGREPVKAARAVLDSGDPKMAMREIVGALGDNVGARRAWERAVTDHLIDKVSNVNPASVSKGTTALDFGKLTKAMKQYEGALAELYASDPDKMNALRRSQRMLEPLASRATSAAPGGPALGVGDRAWKMVEAGLKAHYGILKGGGVVRTLKVMSSLVNSPAAADRLVTRMMFDPELAQHLLTRKVADVGSPAWNTKLAKLLRYEEVGSEAFGGDGD